MLGPRASQNKISPAALRKRGIKRNSKKARLLEVVGIGSLGS